MERAELIDYTESALDAIQERFSRTPTSDCFILPDLGSVTPRMDMGRGHPELLVETFPTDGHEQIVMPFDAESHMNAGLTMGDAIDWLKERHARRTDPEYREHLKQSGP